MELRVNSLKTSIFRAHDDLEEFVARHLKAQQLERSILVITSKLFSLAEGQIAKKTAHKKEELILSEADFYLGEVGQNCHLTIKHGLLNLTAGIDLSNSENGDYLLLPKDPFKSAQKLYFSLKRKFELKEFGVLISDSKTQPHRVGVMGCGISCFGFEPIENLIGSQDLFGQKLKMTQSNLIDALAASAVLMMGEAKEQTPLALISGAPVIFTEEPQSLKFDMTEDLYYPMYRDLIVKKEIK